MLIINYFKQSLKLSLLFLFITISLSGCANQGFEMPQNNTAAAPIYKAIGVVGRAANLSSSLPLGHTQSTTNSSTGFSSSSFGGSCQDNGNMNKCISTADTQQHTSSSSSSTSSSSSFNIGF